MSSDIAIEYLLNRTVDTAVSFHLLIRTLFKNDVRMKKEWSTQYLISNITSSHLTWNHSVIHSRLGCYIEGCKSRYTSIFCITLITVYLLLHPSV